MVKRTFGIPSTLLVNPFNKVTATKPSSKVISTLYKTNTFRIRSIGNNKRINSGKNCSHHRTKI